MAIETSGFMLPDQNRERHPFPHTPPKPPAFTPQEEWFRTVQIVNETLARVLNMETMLREMFEKEVSEISADNAEYKKLMTDTYNAFATAVTDEVNTFEKTLTNAYDAFVKTVESDIQNQRQAFLTFETDVRNTLNTFERNIQNLVDTKVNGLVSDGTFETFIRQTVSTLYGSSSVYKGSDTASNIKAKSGANGDIWYATDEATNYRKTESGWVNIGTGFSIDEVVNARGTDNSLNDRLNTMGMISNAFVGVGEGRRNPPTLVEDVITIPKASGSIKILHARNNVTLTFDDILNQIPDLASLNENGDLLLTFNGARNEALIYDTVEATLKVIKPDGVGAYSNIKYTDIILVESYYGSFNGAFVEYCTSAMVRFRFDDLVNLPFNCHAYSGNNKPISIYEDGALARITIQDSIMVVINEKRYEFTVAKLAEMFPDQVELDTDGYAVITITTGNALLFDFETETLVIASQYNAVFGRRFVLYAAYYKNGYGYLLNQRNKQLIENVVNYMPYLPSIVSSNVATNQSKIEEYANHFADKENIEPFMYFTDPHLTQFSGNAWRAEFDNFMGAFGAYYKESAVDRVFCGGDWFGHSELPSEAYYRLGLINSTMRHYFKNYHMVCGNHDTNYQGRKDENSERWTGKISDKTMANMLCGQPRPWYTVQGRNTEFYIFDSQTEKRELDEYLNEQIEWFAETLLESTAKNIVLMPHMVWYWTDKLLQPVMREIMAIAKAFNERGTYGDYNFINASGRIRFVMCGHLHTDSVDTVNGIPVISTTHARDGGVPTFDLCLIDYDNAKVEMVRVGTGENRTVTI